jgi:hypothetical protein
MRALRLQTKALDRQVEHGERVTEGPERRKLARTLNELLASYARHFSDGGQR